MWLFTVFLALVSLMCYSILFRKSSDAEEAKHVDLKDDFHASNEEFYQYAKVIAVATDEENHMFTFTRYGFDRLVEYMSDSNRVILVDDNNNMVTVAKIKRINITVKDKEV